jgi:RNA polymerase sigma-70 factor (ECF subfamily)
VTISPEELSRLLDSHWGPLVAWVSSVPDAEDVVQQTFVALAGLHEAPENARAWLYKTAKNRAINAHKSALRRTARQRKASRPEQANLPTNTKAEISELKELLGRLSLEQREVIAAKIWGQFTFDEIAQMQGSSKATVWRNYNAAITSLRSIYGVTCEEKT